MGFRFYRRVKLLPGVSINFSKSGASLSLGPRGAKVTVGPRGVRQTVGIPGTGLYYTTTSSARSSRASRPPLLPPAYSPPPPLPTPEERLTLSFFKKLVTPKDEKEWVAGMKAMVQGKEDEAVEHFRLSAHLADGALMAGLVAARRKQPDMSAEYLELARSRHDELGVFFRKYGVTGTFSVPITEEIKAEVGPSLRGVLLVLVESYQQLGQFQEAVDVLNDLYQLDPTDLVVRVSRAELLVEAVGTPEACQQVVELARGVQPKSEVEACLLLFKAGALRQLGLTSAALELADGLLNSRIRWSEQLMLGMKFERSLILEATGKQRQARIDLESIYATDPNYRDVPGRLGLSR